MARQGSFQPFVLATLLAGGFTLVWGMVGMWARQVGEHAAGVRRHFERVRFLADGTPLVEGQTNRHGQRSYHDLAGNPALGPKSEHLWLGQTYMEARPPASAQEASWDQRLVAFTDGRTPPVFWYFVGPARSEGSGYFVGYDSDTKALVGYLGMAGFCEGLVPTGERIPVARSASHPLLVSLQGIHRSGSHPSGNPTFQPPPGTLSGWDLYVLGPDGEVHHVDLQHRRVERILHGLPLRSLGVTTDVIDWGRVTTHFLAARTEDAVLVLDKQGGQRERYPIPDAMRDRPFLFSRSTTGEAVMHWNGRADEDLARQDYHIFWVRPGGRHREATGAITYLTSDRSLYVLSGVILPAPVLLAGLVTTAFPSSLLRDGLASSYPEALALSVRMFWPSLVIAQLIAAALAVLCSRRQTRYGAGGRQRLLWPLFVLAFGLPGWVGYRFGRSWPTLERCPTCDAEVPRDREGCVRCEAEFPAPVLRGTEVFA